MEEKLILQFKLPMITNLSFIEQIVKQGYEKTGNKFTVSFNGSKGYLDNIEITCEGIQLPTNHNRIVVYNCTKRDGSLINANVRIFHSEENGVRISITK